MNSYLMVAAGFAGSVTMMGFALANALCIGLILSRVREFHVEVWEKLGRPRLMGGRYTLYKYTEYIREQKYEQLDDQELILMCRFCRKIRTVGLFVFALFVIPLAICVFLRDVPW